MEKFDHSLVAATMRGYDRNNLFGFISTVIGKDEASRLMEMYRVGTSKHWNGATVFWQISADGEVRGGKIMLYDRLTGHRVQEPYPHITWVHSALRMADFRLNQCFFGEHLLPNIRDKPVAMVESEKTAILATHYLPQYLWLATGGKCSCMNRELRPFIICSHLFKFVKQSCLDAQFIEDGHTLSPFIGSIEVGNEYHFSTLE